jgi:ribosome-binding factor A
MVRDDSRLRRVEDQLQRELAQLIRHEIKDPRVGMVTITAVEVTREFEQATVFFTVLGADAQDSKTTVRVLNNAAGFLRREIGRRLRLRHIPALRFKYDVSIEKGNRLAHLIQQARDSDEQRQQGDTDAKNETE